MKRIWALLLPLSVGTPALAALDVGEAAPDFTTSAAIAGKVYNYSLKESLAKGPVVLFFFPAAFSGDCSDQLAVPIRTATTLTFRSTGLLK